MLCQEIVFFKISSHQILHLRTVALTGKYAGDTY